MAEALRAEFLTEHTITLVAVYVLVCGFAKRAFGPPTESSLHTLYAFVCINPLGYAILIPGCDGNFRAKMPTRARDCNYFT